MSYVNDVCKLGQGADTCRYLVMGNGFECAKFTGARPVIDARVEAGTFAAKGDNCDGKPGHERIVGGKA